MFISKVEGGLLHQDSFGEELYSKENIQTLQMGNWKETISSLIIE